MSFEKKDLQKALDRGHPLFSCLRILRCCSSNSPSRYEEILEAVRSSVENDEVSFSWRGIHRRRREPNPLGSFSRIGELERLSTLLSPLTSNLLEFDGLRLAGRRSIPKPKDWEAFRKYVRYLVECVRHEAGAATAHYEDAEGGQFVYLAQNGDWMPRSGKPFFGFVPARQSHADFIKRLASIGPSDVLVFGYPAETWALKQANEKIEPSAMIRPVFQFKMSYDARRRCFFSKDPMPEVNLSWLNKRFRRRDQQRAFLKSCGFMDIEENEESITGGVYQSLWHMTSTLSAILPDFVREPLLSHSVPAESIKGMENGIYNRAVLMIGKQGRYVKTLLSELGHIAERPEKELENTALCALFQDKTEDPAPEHRPDHSSSLMDPLPMNAAQRQAATSLIHDRISVITGPPGSGKSQVSAAAIACMRLRGNSVLFASKNHKAIDAVMGRLKVEDGRPYVIRTNSKDDPNLKVTFRTMVRLLLEGSFDEEAERHRKALLERAEELLGLRGDRVATARKIADLKNRMAEHEENATFHSRHIPDELRRALDRRPQALPSGWTEELDWIAKALKKGSRAGRIVARARLFLLRLKKSLVPGLAGMPILSCAQKHGGLAALENDCIVLRHAVLYSAAVRQASDAANQVRPLPNQDVLSNEIAELSEKLRETARRALPQDLAARGGGLPPGEERNRLSNLKVALGHLSSGMMNRHDAQSTLEKARQDIDLLLSRCPCWAVTNLSVGSRLPLVAGMFDLSIIDEASQCDVASAIPVLYRAKRAGVIGDPHQLKHIANIGFGQDALIRKRVDFLDYPLSRFSMSRSAGRGPFFTLSAIGNGLSRAVSST